MTVDRQEAHQMVDRLDDGQLRAIVYLLKVMTHQIAESLRNASLDDEPFTTAERSAIAEADEWLRQHEPISNAEVLADFGLTMADWEQMGGEEKSPPRNG